MRLFLAWVVVLASCAEAPRSLRPDVVAKPTRGRLGIIFKTVDEAAVGACNYIWRNEPRATEREFCGVIYRDSEGIKAGLPEMAEATYCKMPLVPPGPQPKVGTITVRRAPSFPRTTESTRRSSLAISALPAVS